jgi:hypothetical protein
MDLTIHLHGYSEIVHYTLQVLGMFRSASFYVVIVNTASFVTGLFYVIQIAISGNNAHWRIYLRKIFGMIFLVHALMLPKVSMNIEDHVEKKFFKVDNIPLAFALPVGLIEKFGNIISKGFEQAFTVIGGDASHNYYNYGTVFSARLRKQILHSRIADPIHVSNMHNFIERCAILPAMIGNGFTKEELMYTSDIWSLIKDNSSDIRRVKFLKQSSKTPSFLTCKQASSYLEDKFKQSIENTILTISNKFYNDSSSLTLSNRLKKQILALFSSKDISVDKIIKQNMMINALSDFKSSNYALTKVNMQSEANNLISYDIAEKTLTGSLAVMKVIIYGSFLFLFPMIIISGGVSKYRNWIVAAFSLTLWPAIFSMLNMIIDYGYKTENIITYSSWANETNKMDSIAFLAAGLTLMIPPLAFWITRMGEGGFIQMTSALMSGVNSSVTSGASEMASGSRGWDNAYIGNQNIDNINKNKHDASLQYVGASSRKTLYDGTVENITAGGKVMHFGGANVRASVSDNKYLSHEGESHIINEVLRNEENELESKQKTIQSIKEDMTSEGVDILHQISESMKKDSSFTKESYSAHDQEIIDTVSEIERDVESRGIAFNASAEAYIKGEMGIKIFDKKAKVGAKVSVSVSGNYSNNKENITSKENTKTSKDSFGTRESTQKSILYSSGVEDSRIESMKKSQNEIERLEEACIVHKDKIKSYSQISEHHKNHGLENTQDLTQEVINRYQERHNVSAFTAYQEVAENTQKAQTIFQEICKNRLDKKQGKKSNIKEMLMQ